MLKWILHVDGDIGIVVVVIGIIIGMITTVIRIVVVVGIGTVAELSFAPLDGKGSR